MKTKLLLVSIIIIFCFIAFSLYAGKEEGVTVEEKVGVMEEKPFAGIKVRFFCGGDEGDLWATIVFNGAKAAQDFLGCDVDYIWSGWQTEKILQQLREAIAAKPDCIVMMSYPGDDALLPLVDQAKKAGIVITMIAVDVPKVQEKYQTGYIGTYWDRLGYTLGKRAVEQFGIKAGDTVILDGNWGEPGFEVRDVSMLRAFEEIRANIVKIKHSMESAADPTLFQPQVAGAVAANPDVKLISYSGGQFLGACPYYMESLGKKPGEIKNIGYDVSPKVIEAFEKGYASLAIDQQPYLEGLLGVLSVCLNQKYGFSLITVDTGSGEVFVDQSNYKEVAHWAKLGIR